MSASSPNVAVNCRFCGDDIPFTKPQAVATEFSLRCPRCDCRAIYPASEVHPFASAPVRRSGTAEQGGKRRWFFG
jgi:hypothetical protein